jgi:hypothetical protein
MKNKIYTYEDTLDIIVVDENNIIIKTSLIYKYPVGSTIDNNTLDKHFTFLELID